MEIKDMQKALKKIKDKEGFTYEQMSAEMGCSTRSVTRWITGDAIPKKYAQLMIERYIDSKKFVR